MLRNHIFFTFAALFICFLLLPEEALSKFGRSRSRSKSKPPGWYPRQQQPVRPQPPPYSPPRQPNYNQPKAPGYGWNVPKQPNYNQPKAPGYGWNTGGTGMKPAKVKYPKQKGKSKIKAKHIGMAVAGGAVLTAMFMTYPRYPYRPGYGNSYYSNYDTDDFYFFRNNDPNFNVNNNQHLTPLLYTFWNGPDQTDGRAFYCFIVDTTITNNRYRCAQDFKNYMKYNRYAVFKLASEYNSTSVKNSTGNPNNNVGFCCGASSLTISIATLLMMLATAQLLLRD